MSQHDLENLMTSDEAISIIKNNAMLLANNDPHGFLKTISEVDDLKVRSLIDDMKAIPDNADSDTKGKSLEKLVSYLLESCGLFRRVNNDFDLDFCQIDHQGVFKVETWAILFGEHDALRNATQHFLGESKRYGTALGVTYVLKFECVKYIRKLKFGIYFTRKGITGTGLKDSQAVLKHLYTLNDQFSVVFKDEDWDRIYQEPKVFGSILCEKIQNFFDRQII